MIDLDLKIDFPSAPDVDQVVTAEMHRAGADIQSRIRARWPVKTGRSRAGWDFQPLPVGFEIENDVRYVAFIKGGSAIIEGILDDVSDQTAERLAESLPDSMLAEVKDG